MIEHPGRLLAVLFVALTVLAAEHLYRLRPRRDIHVKGIFCLQPDRPVEGVQLEALLSFRGARGLRLKVRPNGSQDLALPTIGSSDYWSRLPDRPAHYSLHWLKKGHFDLMLSVHTKKIPRRCRLVAVFPNGARHDGYRFRLRSRPPTRQLLWATAWPVRLEHLPQPRVASHPLMATRGSEEGQMQVAILDMQESGNPISEEDEIRHRAELALQRINTLSPATAYVRSQLIDFLVEQTDFSQRHPEVKAREIGLMLRDILSRRRESMRILCSGPPFSVEPAVEIDSQADIEDLGDELEELREELEGMGEGEEYVPMSHD